MLVKILLQQCLRIWAETGIKRGMMVFRQSMHTHIWRESKCREKEEVERNVITRDGEVEKEGQKQGEKGDRDRQRDIKDLHVERLYVKREDKKNTVLCNSYIAAIFENVARKTELDKRRKREI